MSQNRVKASYPQTIGSSSRVEMGVLGATLVCGSFACILDGRASLHGGSGASSQYCWLTSTAGKRNFVACFIE